MSDEQQHAATVADTVVTAVRQDRGSGAGPLEPFPVETKPRPAAAPVPEEGTPQPEPRQQIPVRIKQPAPVAAGPAEVGEPLVVGEKPRLESRPGAFTTALDAPPDSAIDGGDLDGLVVRAASLRGDEHRYYADPRQDAFAIHPLTTGKGATALLVCVADGVGSQPLSHLGSAAVTRILGQEIGPYAPKLLDPAAEGGLRKRCTEVITHVSQRLELEAANRQVPAQALSTTLVAALIGPVAGDDHRRAVMFAVGDSPAYILRDGHFEQIFGAGAADELAGTATDALPSRIAEPVVMVADLGPGDVTVLCTDGLGNPMVNDDVQAQLAAWWQGGPPSLPAFYWQMSFRAKSFGDDRTAVCVWIG
jgi:serine/threonine protein phosphatase PrpC